MNGPLAATPRPAPKPAPVSDSLETPIAALPPKRSRRRRDGTLVPSAAPAPAAEIAAPDAQVPQALDRRRIRGFYVQALNEAEQADFVAAHAVQGLDDEIALLRLRIKK